MCRAKGRRCDGTGAGRGRRRIRYAERRAAEVLAAHDGAKFMHYASAILKHRAILAEEGHETPPPTPLPESRLKDAARIVATAAHEGQYRRDGRPYIVHPEAVAKRLDDAEFPPAVVAAGWLHDVMEDTDYSADDLRGIGFPEETIQTVQNVTHQGKEDYLSESMPRAVATLDSAAVKDADNWHNTSDLRGPTAAQYAKQVKRDQKYLEARRIIKARLYETEEGQRELAAQFAALGQ